MKKWFDIAVLVTLVSIVACTKVDRADIPVKISYAVASYVHTTKAGELNLKDDEGITTFRSKAWLHAAGGSTSDEFLDEVISWDGSEWSPSRDIYWPKHPQSYLNFVSWHANDGNADIIPDSVTETTFSILSHTVGAQDCILLADEAWRQTSNSTTYGYNGVTAGVPTLFRHMLTRVKVNMRASLDSDPDNNTVTYEVILQEAHLEGIFRTGSLSLYTMDPNTNGTSIWRSSSSPNLLWAPVQGSNTGNIVFVNSNTALTTSATTIMAERSFMPQALNTSAMKMVITYTVITKSNGVATSTEYDIPATIVLNTIKNTSGVAINQWVPNKIYTYNIAINPINQEILLNPTIEDWNGDVNTISISVE